MFDSAALAPTATDPERISIKPALPHAAESTLILGYNQRTPLVIAELAAYAEPGSRALLVTDVAVDLDALPSSGRPTGHLAFEYREAKTAERSVLDALDVPSYDRAIIMSCSDDLNLKRASAVAADAGRGEPPSRCRLPAPVRGRRRGGLPAPGRALRRARAGQLRDARRGHEPASRDGSRLLGRGRRRRGRRAGPAVRHPGEPAQGAALPSGAGRPADRARRGVGAGSFRRDR